MSSGLPMFRRKERDAPAAEAAEGNQPEVKAAIEKLKGKDRVGTAAELLSAAGGAAAGASAAGAAASAAGASTLLGSSALGTLFGGVLVTTTPVGWIVGGAVLAGAAGYGVARLVRSGAMQDARRKVLIKRLKDRLQTPATDAQPTTEAVQAALAAAVQDHLISEALARRTIGLVEAGALAPAVALDRISRIRAAQGSRPKDGAGDGNRTHV
jgi:hypothetical protein